VAPPPPSEHLGARIVTVNQTSVPCGAAATAASLSISRASRRRRETEARRRSGGAEVSATWKGSKSCATIWRDAESVSVTVKRRNRRRRARLAVTPTVTTLRGEFEAFPTRLTDLPDPALIAEPAVTAAGRAVSGGCRSRSPVDEHRLTSASSSSTENGLP
jgi:hypothetical protein